MKSEIGGRPVICLATADACKFSAAVQKAIHQEPPLPKEVVALATMPVKFLEFTKDLSEAEKRLRVIIPEAFCKIVI